MPYDTRVLLDRAIPLERAGEWESALELCRQAFWNSVEAHDSEGVTEAALRSGFCVRHTGNRELATDYLELAHTLAELRNDPGRAARALNGLATLHHVHGELREAENAYSEARRFALDIGDQITCGNIEQNLGALATLRGDAKTALEHYDSALVAYRQVGYEAGMAGVLNNLALLQISLEQLEEAEANLREALAIAQKLGDVVTEGLVHLNQTELLVASHDLGRARTSCDEAFEIFSRLGEHASKADALTFYGIIYREADKLFLAETHLQEAIAVASQHNYPHEEAEAQRELAQVLRMQNRNREALAALNRAHELFTALQARHKQADIDLRIDQLEGDFLTLVREWGESIEAKDRYTRGHCQRVADYACRIGERVGISERDMTWFRMGAFLHDVGKTEIPGEILNKPGRLTDQEREIIERHTIAGDEILAPIPFPWDIRPMVRSHHERWDGRGYPDQLSGQDIPITARILRIADVFDALTTNRSYRQPLTAEQALQIMHDDHGSFDPDLFEVFRELLGTFSGMLPLDDRDTIGTANAEP